MKQAKQWMLAAIILTCGTIISCNGNGIEKNETTANKDTQPEMTANDSIIATVTQYLADSIGNQYSAAEICIPDIDIVNIDNNGGDEITVLGDFWVFNYNISGDTLKTVSGGNHPGMITLSRKDNQLSITSFEQVADGSGNLPSARRIFGKYFDQYSRNSANTERREQIRRRDILNYIKEHGLNVKMYQDYGWDPIRLE